MITIELNNFMGSAYCCSQLYSSKEGFLPITYKFSHGNIYGLVSDFGCGSWALSTSLGGRCEEVLQGSVCVNGHKSSCDELKNYSCFIGEGNIWGINTENDSVTVKECIQRALEISGLPFTAAQIKSLFGLSDERYNRSLEYVSGEIYKISIAVGFALDKKVFCYPWMNTHDVSRYIDISDIMLLKKYDKIVLIPTCRASLKTPICKSFDYTVNFHSYEKKYFCLNSAERKRLKSIKGW